LALSDVQSALYSDLQTITTGNGYNYTYKTIYRVDKSIDKIQANHCPAVSMSLLAASPLDFDEATIKIDPTYGIVFYASIDQDTDESGDLEIALGKMYEDLLKLINLQTSNLMKLDGVQRIEVTEMFPFTKGNLGWGFTTIRIIYS